MTSLLRCQDAEKNKAVSEDIISNEFLKSSGNNMQSAVLHLFKQCLLFGGAHLS